MDIIYATQSKFLEPCKIEINNQFNQLTNGQKIVINFPESSGYNGEIIVDIKESKDSFSTFWENTDPTRFPARIKAAATALKEKKCFGAHKITHNNGELTITRIV
jgi:hypothetical protein